jgi:hypothetical protein
MNHSLAILGPVFALAAWTVAILLLVAFRRVRAALAGEVHPREFALGESPRVPAAAVLANRNYMNLLELPILFYVACLMSVLIDVATATMLGLAWSYVALRVVHSLIHITYNRIVHRFAAFAMSNAALLAMWVLLGIQIAGKYSA